MEPLTPPTGTEWFGLQKQTGDMWQRCSRDDWHPYDRWWRVTELDPILVAGKGFGEGTYRPIWAPHDRRAKKQWIYGDAFTVGEAPAQAPKPAAAPPMQAPAAPIGNVLGAGANGSNGQARAPMGALVVPTIDPMHPIAQFHMLHQVYRDDRAAERERDLHMWTLMLETQRASAQLSLAQIQQFNELMVRAGDAASKDRAAIAEQQANLRQAPLLQQIDSMNRRLAELAQLAQQEDDDDEEGDAVGGALAQLDENPTDGERVLQGIASIMQTVSTFAQTPMGEAIAKRLLNVEPERRIPTVPEE